MRKSLNLKAKIKVNIKYYTRLFGGYFIFFTIIFAIGLLADKLLETAFIVGGYFTTRFLMPQIKHFNSTVKCISISTLTFLFGIAILCIPKQVSVMWSILVGAFIPVIMYIEYLLFKPKIFNVDTCSELELLERCQELRFSEENTSLAVEFFIKKTKQSHIADRLCINEKSVQQRKQRLKEKLNKK